MGFVNADHSDVVELVNRMGAFIRAQEVSAKVDSGKKQNKNKKEKGE